MCGPAYSLPPNLCVSSGWEKYKAKCLHRRLALFFELLYFEINTSRLKHATRAIGIERDHVHALARLSPIDENFYLVAGFVLIGEGERVASWDSEAEHVFFRKAARA